MATPQSVPTKTTPRRSTRSAAPRVARVPGRATRLDVSPQERQRMIEEAAYYRAQQRGFAPGNEVEDWIAAETEIDGLLIGIP
jgi:DUF2934 family protein